MVFAFSRPVDSVLHFIVWLRFRKSLGDFAAKNLALVLRRIVAGANTPFLGQESSGRMALKKMSKVSKSKRQSYPNEFKAEVVRLCESGDKSVAAVARDLKLGISTVHSWVNESRKNTKSSPPPTSSERDELLELRRALKAAHREADILRAAVSIFAKGVTS
jgi:transposase